MKKVTLVIGVCILIWSCEQNQSLPQEMNYGIQNEVILSKVTDGIHTPTGLIADQGLESVLRHCVSCHSSKLITQNRATEEGWTSMIHWMYETQNLPQLGDQEPIIVSYLSKHYAPVASGRRKDLGNLEWYPLQEEN